MVMIYRFNNFLCVFRFVYSIAKTLVIKETDSSNEKEVNMVPGCIYLVETQYQDYSPRDGGSVTLARFPRGGG